MFANLTSRSFMILFDVIVKINLGCFQRTRATGLSETTKPNQMWRRHRVKCSLRIDSGVRVWSVLASQSASQPSARGGSACCPVGGSVRNKRFSGQKQSIFDGFRELHAPRAVLPIVIVPHLERQHGAFFVLDFWFESRRNFLAKNSNSFLEHEHLVPIVRFGSVRPAC